MRVPDRKEGKKETEKIFEDITALNQPTFGGTYNLQKVPVRWSKHTITLSLELYTAVKTGQMQAYSVFCTL